MGRLWLAIRVHTKQPSMYHKCSISDSFSCSLRHQSCSHIANRRYEHCERDGIAFCSPWLSSLQSFTPTPLFILICWPIIDTTHSISGTNSTGNTGGHGTPWYQCTLSRLSLFAIPYQCVRPDFNWFSPHAHSLQSRCSSLSKFDISFCHF